MTNNIIKRTYSVVHRIYFICCTFGLMYKFASSSFALFLNFYWLVYACNICPVWVYVFSSFRLLSIRSRWMFVGFFFIINVASAIKSKYLPITYCLWLWTFLFLFRALSHSLTLSSSWRICLFYWRKNYSDIACSLYIA